MKIYILLAPTASGKTSTAITIAQTIDAEIVSADSMSIYRRMNVGTAKPTPQECAQVPHHLIDIRDPWESFNVGMYLQEAQKVIEDIHHRNKRVLVVGGTALYIKGLIEGIFDAPPADWNLRQELLARDRDSLYEELSKIDPEAAARIAPNDQRRVIRALEVYYLTQTPISLYQKQHTKPLIQFTPHFFGILWQRPLLYARIEARVDQMINDGLLEETRELLALPQQLSHTAGQAIGYREAIAALQGKIEMEDLVETIKRNTRRFAKRQMTWLKRFPVEWVEVDRADTSDKKITQHLLGLFQKALLCLLMLFLTNCRPHTANFSLQGIRVFGGRGTQEGRFSKPRALALSPDNHLYVVDMTGRIQVFDLTGKFLSAFRTPQIEAGKPTGLGFTPEGNLLVADTHYHRILCYSPEGKLILKFGEYGTAPHQFIYVTDAAASRDGFYYITHYSGASGRYDRVQKFDSSGHFIKAWGQGGHAKGEFDRPMSVAIDKEGNLLVCDACNHRIQKFDSQGNFLGQWGEPGSYKDQLSYPYGIAIGPDQCIYVSEFGNNRIQKFSPDGKSLGCFGIAGRFAGMFANPWDLAIGK